MKIRMIGLGQFGMVAARLFVNAGWEVLGSDLDFSKQGEFESLGCKWDDELTADVVMLALFPSQYPHGIPSDGLVVNISSVQRPGIEQLINLGISSDRILSMHPLFGPVSLRCSGWGGKQLIVTNMPEHTLARSVLEVFEKKGVQVEHMLPSQHDQIMLPHAMAFLLAELIELVANCEPKFQTGSAKHMFGLLEFTSGSRELVDLILANPSLRDIWPEVRKKLRALELKHGLNEEGVE